jgi:hypothetical protein
MRERLLLVLLVVVVVVAAPVVVVTGIASKQSAPLQGIETAILTGDALRVSARIWLYKDLTTHPVVQYVAWISLPVFLILFSAGFVHIVAPQSIGKLYEQNSATFGLLDHNLSSVFCKRGLDEGSTSAASTALTKRPRKATSAHIRMLPRDPVSAGLHVSCCLNLFHLSETTVT